MGRENHTASSDGAMMTSETDRQPIIGGSMTVQRSVPAYGWSDLIPQDHACGDT